MVTIHSAVGLSCAVALLSGSLFAAIPQAAPDPAADPAASAPAAVVDSPWPQFAAKDGIAYSIDRPTFTSLEGNQAKLEAPLQVTMSDGSTMSGRVQISATIAPADQAGEVELNRMVVVGATLDGADDTAKVQAAMNALLEKAAMTVARSAIVQDMHVDPVTTPGLRHEPPVIKVVQKPTVLLSIQGPPHSLPLGNTGWRSVTNTPFIVLLDPNDTWFLKLGQSDWRGAKSINGPWQTAAAPPDAVIAALGTPPQLPADVQRNQATADQSRAATKASAPPDVFVATEPTVLISLNGAPQLAPLCDGVQAASNTDSVLLRTASPDRWWTLASGRWFAAQSLNGSWAYVAPADLPAAFANLPQTGQYASALASVPNTTAAKEAVLANAEMRTVTIDRAKAACSVTYKGQAKLAPITGTSLYYAVNASQPVIKVDQTYYCCEAAAWFTSAAVNGPWSLCDKVPEAIYTIPPSSPVFACTFVEVLGSDATTVSFGFTSGYVGTYMQDGTAVYGTGYSYPPADLGGGATQPYPQTYGSDPGYDADSGTFAPPTGNTYIDEYPVVQPIYLSTGYGGWGWCSGWCTGWGWGWGNWGYWNHWNHYWNNWHPYYNHWNQNWNQWHHDQNLQQQNRQAMADRGRTAANAWQRGDTRSPTGQRPTASPTGERPTSSPTGERPTTNPTGERPTSSPTGERPTTNPTGERPTSSPTGERPTTNPTGERPTSSPTGQRPTSVPGGSYAERYPGGEVPSRYPTGRSYTGYGNPSAYGNNRGYGNTGAYGSYSGFHPAYHAQAGSYGGGYRAPQYGNAYRGGGAVRGGGASHGGGGGRR